MEADERLDSWKEIAAYLKRSVRTARRWERDEGLPVHRQQHKALGSVYASKSELDRWRDRSPPPATAETIKSIAILPFKNLGDDRSDEYFAQGLTEEITINLSKLHNLRVIRNAANRGKTAAAQVGVRYLLEGSVRRAGERLRITAQLIDAASDRQIWADAFDGTLDDVFAIQERIAHLIVEALEIRLTADEEKHLTERPIESVAAYDCYLRARYELLRWHKEAIDRAVQLLHDGLAIIGDNARLHATLGLAHLQYRDVGIDLTDAPLDEADRCAARVFAIDSHSAPGLQLRAWTRYVRGDVQGAVLDLKAALQIEPANADSLLLLSNCYLISGQRGPARAIIALALDIDPLTPLTRCMPAYADLLDGHPELSIATYRQMFEMDPSNPMSRLFYVWVLWMNDRAETIAFPPEVVGTVPERIAHFLVHGDASAITAAVETAAAASDVFARLLAHGYTRIGDYDAAMRWLGVAVARGFINYPYLAQHDRLMVPLRNDTRFVRLMEEVRSRWERFEP